MNTEWVKLTISRPPTNTELIFNKLVLIKSIQNGQSNKIIKIWEDSDKQERNRKDKKEIKIIVKKID